MSKRQAAMPAPGLLEAFAQAFDPLWTKLNQREGFRRYLEGLLLPTERNKTLTGLANTEPGVGAQEARAQNLQWYLSESNWDEGALNQRRLDLLVNEPSTAPHAEGALVIDETGDPKDGTHTAHVGRQYLGRVGKTDNGVVSVSSLWADERVYYPWEVEPYTPAAWFEKGRADPAFRTKLTIALRLVQRAVQARLPFKAVVADCFYGEDRTLRTGLQQLGVGYVMALKPSHGWRHPLGTSGSLEEVARATPWKSAAQPGAWLAVDRSFRDGHTERWWALEVVAGPYGPHRASRAVVVTTDPLNLPALTTWYLITNLPAPRTPRAESSSFPAAALAEIVRLYGLRTWVEQSYKQVKTSLGWAQYQVRSDRAIRRHWFLVFCAFTFCWWQAGQNSADHFPATDSALQPTTTRSTGQSQGQKKPARVSGSAPGVLARRLTSGAQLARTSTHAQAVLAGILGLAPTVSPSALS
jgi:hypothetical protein